MARQAGRRAADTQRLVLDAAARAVRDRGLEVTVEQIAATAGVSKGGVLYHYASKDALMLALLDDLLDAFRASVLAELRDDDDDPGRLTRAYVRSLLGPGTSSPAAREAALLMSQLMRLPGAAELARRDNERWAAELGADGVPRDVLDLVVAAADGAQLATIWGGTLNRERLNRLTDRLVAMTREA